MAFNDRPKCHWLRVALVIVPSWPPCAAGLESPEPGCAASRIAKAAVLDPDLLSSLTAMAPTSIQVSAEIHALVKNTHDVDATIVDAVE